MPRDNDKNNDSRGRRDRPAGSKGRSGAARGPEKKFAKRGFAGKDFAGKSDGDKRPYAGRSEGAKSYGKKPFSEPGQTLRRQASRSTRMLRVAPMETLRVLAATGRNRARTFARETIVAATSVLYTPRRRSPGLALLQQEIRRQEILSRRTRPWSAQRFWVGSW